MALVTMFVLQDVCVVQENASSLAKLVCATATETVSTYRPTEPIVALATRVVSLVRSVARVSANCPVKMA